MNKLNPDDVARLRAAKRSIVDSTILACVAFPVGDPEGRKVLGELRAAHRRINRYLDAGRGDDSLEPHPGIEPSQASYEEAPSP
jgi:hypothetical protein